MTVALLLGFSLLSEFRIVLNVPSSIPIFGSNKRLFIYNLFLFRALPFFLMGISFRLYKSNIEKFGWGMQKVLFLIILGSCLSVIERILFVESQFYIGIYLTVFAFCVTTIEYPNLNIKSINFIGKELSMYIYILHIAVGKMGDLVFTKLGLWNNMYLRCSRSLVILICSILLAYILCIVQKRIIGSNFVLAKKP